MWHLIDDPGRVAVEAAETFVRLGMQRPLLLGTEDAELLVQAGLLRDIFGPLQFRRFTLNLSLLTPTVVKLAQTIYDERDCDRMTWPVP